MAKTIPSGGSPEPLKDERPMANAIDEIKIKPNALKRRIMIGKHL
jgi:hypothetical protein